jgi:alkanesulfonate monooxygenase SsuD/methylene tetrahydromethanopterin reductase-like flavin-dependent oxidoreductase (luciferase family)
MPMKLGALLGPVTAADSTRSLAEQARRYAGAGFESLWSAQAVGRGFMLMDPFVALTVAATVTDKLEIGTAVLQVPLYHPMDLAHRIFSLRQLCGDRLLCGVGAGSTRQDFAAFGRDYTRRFSSFAAGMAQLREIFATGRLAEADLSPWPAVRGGPPLLLGSWGKGVETAATAYDGWIASAAYRSPTEVVAALARYRACGGGRAIVSTIQLGPSADLGQTKAMLEQFAAAGFDDAVVMLLPGGPSADAVRALV